MKSQSNVSRFRRSDGSFPLVAGGDLTLSEALRELERATREEERLRARKEQHGGSRYLASGATPEAIEHVAKGGSLTDHGRSGFGTPGVRQPGSYDRGGRSGKSLARFLKDVADHRTEGLTPAYAVKALAESTDPAGGYMLTAELYNEVALMIRNRVAVEKLGVTHVQPRSKIFELPGLAAGASASWLAENAAIPASAEQFQIAAQMVPRPLGSLVAISNRMLADATQDNPLAAESVEKVIQSDLADVIAVTQDQGFLNGNGSIAPKGILQTSGVTTLSGAYAPTNGFSLSAPPSGTSTYGLLLQIVGALQQLNAPFASPGWIFSGRTLTSLMGVTNTYGEPLLASANLLSVDPTGTTGRLLGYPFVTTNAISNSQTQGTANNASSLIFSGDWNECFIGDWQEIAFASSSEASYSPDGVSWVSAFQSEQTVFKAVLWCDMAIRRPNLFCVVNGLLP